MSEILLKNALHHFSGLENKCLVYAQCACVSVNMITENKYEHDGIDKNIKKCYIVFFFSVASHFIYVIKSIQKGMC